MSFDFQRIVESKQAYRKYLAALPIGEKLRLLDAMRERAIEIRGSRGDSEPISGAIHEGTLPYRAKKA